MAASVRYGPTRRLLEASPSRSPPPLVSRKPIHLPPNTGAILHVSHLDWRRRFPLMPRVSTGRRACPRTPELWASDFERCTPTFEDAS